MDGTMKLALIVLAVVIAAFLIALIWRLTSQRALLRKSLRTAAHGGVASAESVRIGGVEQWILLQGEDASKPVLLLLHGGPGAPLPGVSSRGLSYSGFPAPYVGELTKHFVLVYWDQRGAGKSYSKAVTPASMNFAQLVADTGELTDWLRNRFGQRKIYLAGSSWGTIIGLKAAAKYPEKYAAYFGMQQILNWTESDRLAHAWVVDQAQQTGNEKAVAELTKVGLPPYPSATWGVLRKWLMKYGGFGAGKDTSLASIFGTLFKQLLISPDYTFGDLKRMGAGMKMTADCMLPEIHALDLVSEISEIRVPVVLFHGRHDRTQPGEIVERYFRKLDAPQGKSLIWLERSGHMYSREDALLVEEQLIAFAQRRILQAAN